MAGDYQDRLKDEIRELICKAKIAKSDEMLEVARIYAENLGMSDEDFNFLETEVQIKENRAA